MQTTSALYKTILSDPAHLTEIRLDIDGTIYDETSIISLKTSKSFFGQNSVAVGSCITGEIDAYLKVNSADVPRMAELRPYVRLVLGSQASEWIPKGVYFINTREEDTESGALTIHGFDAMLKAEQYYLTTTNYNAGWPLPMQTVVDEIAGRMGVTIDNRTVIQAYTMQRPSEDLTMREVLGFIGAAHGGNWIMTDNGELRLISIASIPAETNFLIDDIGNPLLFGEVRIIV